VELARCRYSAWRRAPAVEEARCRRDRIAKATASMARGSRESRTQDRTHCGRVRGWPGWILAGALVEDTQHRGPRYSRIERSRIARAPTRQDRPARHRAAQTPARRQGRSSTRRSSTVWAWVSENKAI